MKLTLIALFLVILVFVFHDSCSVLLPKEKMWIRLTDEWGERVGEDTSFTFKVTDTTNVSLPAILTHSVGMAPPAGRTPRPYDTIVVNAIITKHGTVKRAWIVSSPNTYFNKAVLKAVLLRQYQPALRKGIPFDTLITIPFPLKPE